MVGDVAMLMFTTGPLTDQLLAYTRCGAWALVHQRPFGFIPERHTGRRKVGWTVRVRLPSG